MTHDLKLPKWIIFWTYWIFAMLIVVGHIRDLLDKVIRTWTSKSMYLFNKYILRRQTVKTVDKIKRKHDKRYAPLMDDFEHFYTRRLYRRIEDCWNRPISSVPGVYIDVLERSAMDAQHSPTATGNTVHALNLGSYNYLGFAEGKGGLTHDACVSAVEKYGPATGSSRSQLGTTELHAVLEKLVAAYVGKSAAVVMGMGFAVNASLLPGLIGRGDAIISDSLNHASLVTGARASGAHIQVFQHNDYNDLDRVLRRVILGGQPVNKWPWKRVVVLVEGIYSMEGEICDLPNILRITKKYKAYLYVDEAHSIGALGKTGRGVCEYHGVDPAEVDILMGTFTKSFGSSGGYVAASHAVIARLKYESMGYIHDHSMSAVCAQQAITSLQCIAETEGGKRRLACLERNSRLFRTKLIEMGFSVIGDHDSPVVPVLVCLPSKFSELSRQALLKKLALVVVGFPATPILQGRVRFCLSAGHTEDDIYKALNIMDELGDVLAIKYKGAKPLVI